MLIFEKLEGEERKQAIEAPGKSWRRWAREDLARYWYVILCLFIDFLFNLNFTQAYIIYGGEKYLLFELISLLALVPIIYVEYLVYKRLFPDRF